MSALEKPDELDWQVSGDVPSLDPNWLVDPARLHFENRVEIMEAGVAAGHEVATIIDNELLPVKGLTLVTDKKRHQYQALNIHEAGKHKKEIAVATLTVAGLLLAANRLRVQRKK